MSLVTAPLSTYLFIYYYGNKWINKIKKTDIGRARHFGNIFRFINDLTVLNDCSQLGRSFQKIYLPELELKKENLGYVEGSFLDLMINMKDKKISTKLFDKRDSFPFSIG